MSSGSTAAAISPGLVPELLVTDLDASLEFWVHLPIFEGMDCPMAPFDAITQSWNLQGFAATDRAMGTDFYGQQDDSDSLRGLTIRGTSEGISLSAVSV